MGHLSVVKELLDQEKAKSYPYGVGMRCDRKKGNCASFWHDRKCYGPACPWKGNGK